MSAKLAANTLRASRGLLVLLVVPFLAACGGPSLIDEHEVTPVPTPTVIVEEPTAAVGATTGAPCESGTLKFKDLPAVEAGWRDGVAAARARALIWQEDAVLVELEVSCELFESGFRWQATFFSRNAQAYFTADTAEAFPVNFDPDTIIPLPERDVDFADLYQTLVAEEDLLTNDEDVVVALAVRVSTNANPIGPPGVPTGAAIYHVSLQTRGEILELYVDGVQGNVYQFE
ncbi:MAG: hypothetical protein M3Y37_00545 [Chloroflexota bacterium]|nr:hypothetical protein [Chloroflexota bacterium]